MSEPGVWYECARGDQKLRVQFNPEVIGRLQKESVTALRGTGGEVGGVLLGDTRSDADSLAIRIERAETIDYGNPRGASYILSAEDRVRFAAAVHACRRGPGEGVLGFYRSQTRPDLRLYEDDMALAGASFQEPVDIIVLLKPLESGLCTAGLFFRDPGDGWPDFCDLEIPFFDPNAEDVAIQLASPVFAVTGPGSAADLARATEDADQPAGTPLESPGPPIRKAPFRPGRWLTIAALAAMAGLLVFLIAFWTPYLVQRWRLLALSAPPPAASLSQRQRFGLQVSSQDDRLILTWNRDAPALRNAPRALLEVQDGTQRKQLNLDSAELTGGSLVYLPVTGDVLFRLMVSLDDGHTAAESVRFLSGRTASDTTGSILLSQTAQPLAPAAKPTTAVARRASDPSPRRWQAPHSPALAPLPTAMPDPPRLPVADRAATPAAPGKSLRPPPSPQVAKASTTQPVPAPDGEPLRVARYAPPRVIRQAPVSIPPSVRSMLTGKTDIDVRVTIDPRGKVIRTELVSATGAGAHLLAMSAMDAARLCQFTPAQLDGIPTRSEMVISFRFAR